MSSVFWFKLVAVLDLAEHAVAATAHADPVDEEPTGPALLLVADDGVYFMSNGLPQPPPGPDQPAESTVRAVFAEHLGPEQPTHDGDDLLVALPLCQPGEQLIEQLRTAARTGADALVVTLLDDQLAVTAIKTPEAPHLG
ncbi:hypothetical protein I0C86_38170 [Plantactinospora sp. S1510]|uniref:Uncharacterized protein n=1 Tax=Plantactinospora alkalitolerans TaxID=2789879 RepID=A0ABS0H8V4_9ACTN|nr:hypothetical protein [Plantactinospora alkalitolerans]MBF9134716.1 hypothetical protein [Plantactinospora alkalitolerans]